MANFSLNLGNSAGSGTDIISGSIVFSREGQYGRVHVYGDRRDIETTISTTAALTGSLGLQKNYDETLEAGDAGPPPIPAWTKDLALEDVRYNQVYVRYAVDPQSDRWRIIDSGKTLSKSPRGYRAFKNLLIKQSTDNDEQAGYGFVKEGTAWKRLKEKGFSRVNFDEDANVPSVYFDSNPSIIDQFKAEEKVYTCRLKGFMRIFERSGQSIPAVTTTDFSPFKTVFRDVYKGQLIFNSYRKSPSSSSTTGSGQDDTTNAISWATQEALRLRQKNYSVNLVLQGDFEIDDSGLRPIVEGDVLETIVTRTSNLGAATDETLAIDLPVLSVQYKPSTDTTIISVGRA